MAEEHTYRVLVRGRFTDLDAASRERLQAAAAQHDMINGGFTDQGALSYDQALDFFTYRVELRAEVEPGDKAVCDRGLALASSAVEKLGVDFRDMRAAATDLDMMKIRRRR